MGFENLIPGVGQAKLIVGAIGLAAVAVPSAGWYITAHTLSGVREWQREVITSTTAAAHARLPIATKDVPDQIDKLGEALDQVESATDTAVANNVANNGRIEAAQDQTTKEVGDDIDKQIAAARAAGASDYARRMQAGGGTAPNRGDAGQPSAAQAGNAAGTPVGAGGAPSLDAEDIRICSDNTVKAEGWQAFWNKLIAIPQAVPDRPGS